MEEDKRWIQLIWFSRIALFINYFWFGILKFFPGLSPAQSLAGSTIFELTFHFIPETTAVIILASVEVVIGFCFLFKRTLIIALYAMLIHMVFTFFTFVFFPDSMFTIVPYGLTLAGQYVVKNLVFLALGLLILKRSKR